MADTVCSGRALASDFDGTLYFGAVGRVHPLHRFLPRDLAAIRGFREAGGLFGMCTGRPLGAVLTDVGETLDFDFAITSSGACVMDGAGSTLFLRDIPRDTVRALLDMAKGHTSRPPFVATQAGYKVLGSWRIPGIPKVFLNQLHMAGSLDEALADGPAQVVSLGFSGSETAQMFVGVVNERFAGSLSAFQNVDSVDVVPTGCSRGSGLAVVRERLGLELVGCIGDSFNDLPLLAEVDVAYTFNRSPEGVRAAADVLVDDVAGALEDFERR